MTLSANPPQFTGTYLTYISNNNESRERSTFELGKKVNIENKLIASINAGIRQPDYQMSISTAIPLSFDTLNSLGQKDRRQIKRTNDVYQMLIRTNHINDNAGIPLKEKDQLFETAMQRNGVSFEKLA